MEPGTRHPQAAGSSFCASTRTCLQVEQEMEPGKRHQLARRLAKAAVHAGELVRLTGARCDARTQVSHASDASSCCASAWWEVSPAVRCGIAGGRAQAFAASCIACLCMCATNLPLTTPHLAPRHAARGGGLQ